MITNKFYKFIKFLQCLSNLLLKSFGKAAADIKTTVRQPNKLRRGVLPTFSHPWLLSVIERCLADSRPKKATMLLKYPQSTG